MDFIEIYLHLFADICCRREYPIFFLCICCDEKCINISMHNIPDIHTTHKHRQACNKYDTFNPGSWNRFCEFEAKIIVGCFGLQVHLYIVYTQLLQALRYHHRILCLLTDLLWYCQYYTTHYSAFKNHNLVQASAFSLRR